MLKKFIKDYQNRLINCIQSFDWLPVTQLAQKILLIQKEDRHIFLCGNGGSAVNSMHIANDLLYLRSKGKGIKVTALPANQAVLTCLANDIGYENIFSFQLKNFNFLKFNSGNQMTSLYIKRSESLCQRN